MHARARETASWVATACVVGAGPAGLVTTKTLREAGIEVDCFDFSPHVGGQWVLDNPNGRSAVYRSLRTNTTLAMSRLSDYTMPEDWPDFPSHEQVRAWWESYVDAFGLSDRIHLGCEVQRARGLDPTGWEVAVRRGADTEVRRYDALLACTGSYWSPRLPDVPGVFAGARLHAQAYRDPETPIGLLGKRVIVVGIGNTGCEIACEIAEAGAEAVLLSARSGTWILPKHRNGRPAAEGAPMMHPCDPVPAPFRFLPEGLRERAFDRMATAMFRRMFAERMRRLETLGLPAPPANPNAKRATISDPLPDALESGAVAARPEITRFDGSTVHFADGSRDRADVVIFATGFHLHFPYLPDAFAPVDDDFTLFRGTLHPDRPDLFIVGISRPTGAFWPIAELHTQFAAALVSGRYRLPSAAKVRARARPILGSRSFNPALFGLAMREEIRRGERRARRRRSWIALASLSSGRSGR